MATIELVNINKTFGTGLSQVTALKNVNFKADKGQLILILGPSGSGKSTFLTILGNLQTPSSGQVKLNGLDLAQLSSRQKEKIRLEKIGFVLQAYNLVPYLKVKDQFNFDSRIKKNNNLSSAKLNALLAKLEIADLVDKYPANLSGGQNQRVAIARALYTNPEIILADEPTAALDSHRVEEVGLMLHDLAQKENKAVIVVTHDLRLRKHADSIYQITDGILTKEA